MEAVIFGNRECVKLLIDKETGRQNKIGMSALMYASQYGRSESVKLLLPHEADLKDNNGKSALDHAKNDEIRKIIQEYIEKEKNTAADNKNTTRIVIIIAKN